MKIISVVFDFDNAGRYEKLARVFEHSVRKNCPGAEFALIKMAAPPPKGGKRCFDSNTVKLEEWARQLAATDHDVVFMDCDMVVLRDLADAFKDPNFDVGITTRRAVPFQSSGGSLPINGGVIFIRNNEAGREYVDTLVKKNREMYEDKSKHDPWRAKYGGMNQAAMGYLQDHPGGMRARVKHFPCNIWNACKPEWMGVSTETYVVHIKSDLRRAALNDVRDNTIDQRFYVAINVWRKLAAEAGVIAPDAFSVVQPLPAPQQLKKPYFPQRIGGKVVWHSRARR